MTEQIYLDYHATTLYALAAYEAMDPCLWTHFGNPSRPRMKV